MLHNPPFPLIVRQKRPLSTYASQGADSAERRAALFAPARGSQSIVNLRREPKTGIIREMDFCLARAAHLARTERIRTGRPRQERVDAARADGVLCAMRGELFAAGAGYNRIAAFAPFARAGTARGRIRPGGFACFPCTSFLHGAGGVYRFFPNEVGICLRKDTQPNS